MSRADRAVAFVAAQSAGGPVDPSWRVTVNFHPDRTAGDGAASTAGSLAATGRYLSQFATGTSSGGLTAHPGGDRWRWESRIFGGVYDDAPAVERPVYGALDVGSRPAGGAPRFGSAHLRLHTGVLDRTTFCFPDSNEDPVRFGVAGRCGLIAEVGASGRDLLDDYVEAHVHGGVLITADVAAIVLDPCFEGTDVERAALACGAPVEFHRGFRLTAKDFDRSEVRAYRGPAVAALGRGLAGSGTVDARVVGDAARAGGYDAQDLKRVWHCLARFGERVHE